MSDKVVNGRKPLSSKPTFGAATTDDVFGNQLALSPEIQEDLEKQGLVGRFVNAKHLTENGGYHAKGWRVYKKQKSATMASDEFKFGNDPEGIIRRGDCILAVKSKEAVAMHKSTLRQRAGRYENFKKQQADNLRKAAREQGLETRIDEDHEYEAEENE